MSGRVQPADGAAARAAFVRGSRRVWNAFAAGWRATPAVPRRRWIVTLAAGLGICLALSVAVTLAGMRIADAGTLDWEREWLLALERGNRLSFHSALWLEGLGSSAMVMPVVAVAAIIAALAGRSMRALLVLAAYLPAKLLIFAGWTLWDRARPDFIADGVAVPGSLHSFPSGHTLQTITVYGILAWFWARASASRIEQVVIWMLAAALVAAVALARLRLGTHWPSDVVAGYVVGIAWLAVLVIAQRRLEAASG